MSFRLEAGLALLLALAITIAVIAGSRAPKPPPDDQRASTFLAGPTGSRALHQVLVRLGVPVVRRRTSLFRLGDTAAGGGSPALLVVLAPPMELQPAELDRVVGFVEQGRVVLAAGRGGGITGCAGWRLAPQWVGGDSMEVRRLAPPTADLTLPRVVRTLVPDSGGSRPGLGSLAKGRRRSGARREGACARLAPLRVDTLVATVDGAPVIVRLTYRGGGGITLAADAGWFRNRAWRETDVPQVVLPLFTGPAARGAPGAVAWDEYHQGFGRETGSATAVTLEWLGRSPAGWAILQLLAVGLVGLGMTAVRFGPARSVIDRRRRSSLEHVDALAAGLASAAGADTAVELMVAGLRRRLSRAGTATPHARDLNGWLETLTLAVPTARGRAAVAVLRRLVNEPGGPPERVLAAAQAVEDVWEELHPRTTRDGS